MSQVDLPRLVALLVERLNPVLPDGIRVGAVGDMIETLGRDGSYGTSGRYSDDPAVVAEGLLSHVQDDVAHATRGMAWPGDGRSLPVPWARVEADTLLLGYGDGVLTFEPIPLRYFMPSDGGADSLIGGFGGTAQ